MAGKQTPDRHPSRKGKKGLNLKKDPIGGKGGKSAGPERSSSKRSTSRVRESQPADQDRSTEQTFLIVGIGASAGGLEACKKLLEHLPPDTGMAFVLVQHLAPSHASALADMGLPAFQSASATGLSVFRRHCISKRLRLADVTVTGSAVAEDAARPMRIPSESRKPLTRWHAGGIGKQRRNVLFVGQREAVEE
jgi:hypothetical protein